VLELVKKEQACTEISTEQLADGRSPNQKGGVYNSKKNTLGDSTEESLAGVESFLVL